MSDITRITINNMRNDNVASGYSIVTDGAGTYIHKLISGGGGGSSSLEVQENNTQIATNVTILNFEGGVDVTDAGSGKATVTISGGGGGGGTADATIWMADMPPASGYVSGSTKDDEFDDASFDTSLWTEFDVASTQTVGEDEFGVYMSTTSTNHLQGIFQAAPSGITDWSFTTYVAPLWDRVSSHRSGILLLEDTSDLSGSECELFAVYRGGAGFGWQVIYHTTYNTWSADDYNTVADTRPPGMYLRFRADGTNWHFDYSWDGRFWVSNVYERVRRFAVTGIGLGHKFDNSGHKARFTFARFKNDSSKSQILYGDRVNVWRAS